MTNLEFLHDLNRRHARLEVALSALKADLTTLQNRLEEPEVVPPPLPVFPPPVPGMAAPLPVIAPPLMTSPEPVMPPLPEIPSPPPVAATEPAPTGGSGFELQFGRWLARIGVVFALCTLVFFSVLVHNTLYKHLGPWSKLAILAVVSGGLIAGGLRLEGRDQKMLVYGRTLAGGGLACLYYTLFGAIYVPQLRVIPSELFGGLVLLAWSAGVLILAERRKSELLSIFAISLAYFSSAITPGDGFIMAADLLLAATAVVFLLRNAWTGLPYICLVGTYAGFLRQAVVYRGPLDFDWVGVLEFRPAAVYLTGAWLIFTAAVLLSRSPSFSGQKRTAFLCLNNGAWVGLLLVAANLGSFGHTGAILGATGGVLLATWMLAQMLLTDAPEVEGAYLAQGLGLATAGIAIAYSGMTRGLLLTIESVFLVASGAFSRKAILRIGGALTAVLGAVYLAHELIFGDLYPWMLTFGGALAMLANAWLARREMWGKPREMARERWVAESGLHVLLAIGIIVAGIVCHGSLEWIAPALALAALLLALAVCTLPLFELAPLSQILLVLAQAFSFGLGWDSPGMDNWFGQPQWSHNLVALVTMVLMTGWARQTRIRTNGWLQPLTVISALAMVAFCYGSVEPHATAQTWMISAALLSLIFLAYGAWSRLWAFMVSGQVLLALSVATFFYPDNAWGFPWAWWAAAVPIAVVFATGWMLRETLPRYAKAGDGATTALRVVARVYQSVALGLLVRWVFGVALSDEITFLLLALGTAFVAGCVHLRSSYGVRAGFVLSAAGIAHYLAGSVDVSVSPFTWLDGGAFTLLLAQPALLRRWGRGLISEEESWIVILASSAMTWLFVSNCVVAEAPQNLTLGWALVAVILTVVGFAAGEHRQRWCGLAILAAALVRVAVHDFWVFSDLLKVLTFFALTVICLGLSFLYYKFGDRLKEWL